MKSKPDPAVFHWAMRLGASLAAVSVLTIFCAATHGATVEVRMDDYFYEPQFLAVNPGDTVVWKNYGGEHTATSDEGFFGSDVLGFDEEFSHTFTDLGSYPYHCSLHGTPGFGMFGSIVVSEPGGNTPPSTPVNQLPLNNATNQPVAVQLRANGFSDPDGIDFHAASQWVLRFASNNSLALDSGEVAGSLTNYSPVALSEGTSYDWQVRYMDGRGAWSQYSTTTRFTTLISFNQQGVGLRASYNNMVDFFSPLIVVTNATIDFSWGGARPNRRISADAFAVCWEGSLLPQFTEQYHVQFQFQGRARVWVKNQLLIDEWSGCPFGQARRGSVSLVAGQLAAVRVEYAADPLGALAILRWTSPNVPMEVIPSSRLFPHAP